MVQFDPGHFAEPAPHEAEPAAVRRRSVVPLIALVLAVVALIMAFIPNLCFAAGLPALAAVVLGFVGLVVAARRAFAVAAVIVGTIALVAAVVVSVVQITGPISRFVASANGLVAGAPGGEPSPGGDPTGAPGLGAGPHTVVYRTTGDGRSTITYSATVDGASGFDREADVAVPHMRSQRVTVDQSGAADRFVMTVIGRDATTALGCSISIDGREVVVRTSSGSTGTQFVTCTARTEAG